MRSKLLADGPQKTYALIFEAGDEVMEVLRAFASKQGLSAATFQAIGAFQEAVLAFFQIDRKEYKKIPVLEQTEVLTLAGDVALKDGEPAVHAHIVLGREDGSTVGGHLLEARVRPTLEVILVESPAHLKKTHDPKTGLALIDPSR